MRVQLTFRSGAQVVVDAEDIEVVSDGPNQRISAIRYKRPSHGNLLLGVVPADVVAAVALETPGSAAAVPAPDPRIRLSGDEDCGVELKCRDCSNDGGALAYLKPYPEYLAGSYFHDGVPIFDDIADFLAVGDAHIREKHGREASG